MRFRVLGPLRVWDGQVWSTIRAAQQRAVLALLLTEQGQVVSSERLIDEIWQDRPPPTALGTIHGYVLRLRRLIGDDEHLRLVTHGSGYRLVVESGDLDSQRFEHLIESGRQKLASGESDAAVAEYSEGLALWRGQPFLDIPACPAVSAEAQRLEGVRLTALEEYLGAQLDLGRHDEVVDQLGGLVQDHPLRERLWAHLMLALHRCGRRAEALEAYQRARTVLVEELGIEPDRALRDLHTAILTEEPQLTAPDRQARLPPVAPRPVQPAQLPADVPGFVGRRDCLDWLKSLLPPDSGEAAPAVVAVVGAAGVGKSALAVHWAHRVHEAFPDGQLFVNLGGYGSDTPMPPAQALARFLRALGVHGSQVPVEVDEAAALYRTLLAGRRMLVLLDNAGHPDQVRPLLPNSAGCLVLVTSRERLGGLIAREGARRLALEVLEPTEARELLAGLIGEPRIADEPGPAAELAALCGYLPLALRIAAANVLTQPKVGIAEFATVLATGDRLAALRVDDDEHAAVQVAFDHSYAYLTPPAQRMFRLLGLVPGPSVTVEAAAALANHSARAARQALERLAAAHLTEPVSPGRYGMHDLIRDYAAERARHEETLTDRRAALSRLYRYYLDGASDAADHLYPHVLRLPRKEQPPADAASGSEQALHPKRQGPSGINSAQRASDWLDEERANLTAAVLRAAADGHASMAWRLADALRGYLYLRMLTGDWRLVAEAGLTAAQAGSDLRGQAAALIGLATLHWTQGRHRDSVELFERALVLARRSGWIEGEAAVLGNLGNLHWALGRLDQAAAHYLHALEVHVDSGATASEATALGNLALVYFGQGRLDEAERQHARALELHRSIGSQSGEARTLSHLGEVYHAQSRLDDALVMLGESLELTRAIGDRSCEGDALRSLAAVYGETGRHLEALDTATTAITLARQTGDRRLEAGTLITRAEIHRRLGQPWLAADGLREAHRLACRLEDSYLEAEALIGLAQAHADLGHADRVADWLRRADEIAEAGGYRLLIARAKRSQIER